MTRCNTCDGRGWVWREWSIPDADGDTHGHPVDCPTCRPSHDDRVDAIRYASQQAGEDRG